MLLRLRKSKLEQHASLALWQEAWKQAMRSPLFRFKTGAIVFNSSGEILSRGCSHVSHNWYKQHSKHAEQHALEQIPKHIDYQNLSILIVTINKSGNYAISSRPCLACANLLEKSCTENNGIKKIIYPERTNSGEIIINTEHPGFLLRRTEGQEVTRGQFAKEMKIK